MVLSAVNPSVFALAVVARAIGTLDDASGARGSLVMLSVEGLGPGGLVQKGHEDQEHNGDGGEGEDLVGRHLEVFDEH